MQDLNFDIKLGNQTGSQGMGNEKKVHYENMVEEKGQ